ncbi:MAG: alpha/beta hydrolase [Myxococcales bacterium]
MRIPSVRALRAQLMGGLAEGFFEGLSRVGRLHPRSDPEAHGIEVIRDVAYTSTGHLDQRLDIYRRRDLQGPRPVVLYIHGGGFHMLSKETHWIMALIFARAGYVVFNMSYRLAPTHRYPAALEDACDAYVWMVEHAAKYGADLSRVVVAGESAGANLSAALAVTTCYARPEPFARRVFATGVVPRAMVLGCGILQVSDPERLWRRREMPRWLRGAVLNVCRGYVGRQSDAELADPLLILEQGTPPLRPLPACFAFVGTRDPLLDDTRRLGPALTRLGVEYALRYYPGELHAFHALVFREPARRCWRDKLTFLHEVLGTSAPLSRTG